MRFVAHLIADPDDMEDTPPSAREFFEAPDDSEEVLLECALDVFSLLSIPGFTISVNQRGWTVYDDADEPFIFVEDEESYLLEEADDPDDMLGEGF